MGKEDIFILHCTISLAGGVGTVIKNLVNDQLNLGYNVGLVYIDNDLNNSLLKDYPHEVELFPLKKKNFKGSGLLLGLPLKKLYLKEKRKRENVEVILHAHNPVAIGMFNGLTKVPIICTIHGVNPNSAYLSRKLTNYILKRMRYHKKSLIAVSEHTAKYYNKEIGASYIQTIRNGVRVQENNKYRVEKNEDYFTIGYTSYIDDLKGWKCLLDAYLLLLPEYKNKIKLVLAGSGPRSEIEKLKDIIAKQKLEDNVTYLGFVPDAGNELMPLFDLLVLPSKSEGIPMTILEALGYSVPVLASPVGGIPEVIINGYNGFLLSRDAKAYSEKIKEIYENKDMYEILKNNAHHSYRSFFNSEIMNYKYYEAYKNAIVVNGERKY